MKKWILYILLFTFSNAFAQVGIGTTTPLADLHVAGSVAIQENFKTNVLPMVTNKDEDFNICVCS